MEAGLSLVAIAGRPDSQGTEAITANTALESSRVALSGYGDALADADTVHHL